MCTRDEEKWKDKLDFELRSMAQTRAISKALRLPLGFIVELAGFNPTPAEEMEGQRAQTTTTLNQANGSWQGIVRKGDRPGSDLVLRVDADDVSEIGFAFELPAGVAQVVARGDVAIEVWEGGIREGAVVKITGTSETVHATVGNRRRPFQRITARTVERIDIGDEVVQAESEPEPEAKTGEVLTDQEIDQLTT